MVWAWENGEDVVESPLVSCVFLYLIYVVADRILDLRTVASEAFCVLSLHQYQCNVQNSSGCFLD